MANCILNSINHLRPVLTNGNFGPEFENFPRLEPFFIPSISIGNRRDFRANFKNVIIKGGSLFQIEKLKANMKELKFDAIVRFPRLEMNANYDLIFNLFGLRLSGKGNQTKLIWHQMVNFNFKSRRLISNY